MSKFVEILAMALGGFSLFAVCFLGFAAMSGKPLGSIPGMGSLIETNELATVVADADSADAKRAAEIPPQELPVVQSSIGVMGAWSLPSPFTQVELKELTDELKSKRIQLEAREAGLSERELEVDERAMMLNDRFEMLEQMSDSLEEFRNELDLREQEVSNAEDATSQREQVKWAERAKVLTELESSKAAERMVSYPPEDAAHILRAMEPTTAYEIINAIPSDWQAYLDAYTELGPTSDRP